MAAPTDAPAASGARPAPDDELLITRVFDAPLSVVWKIWRAREHLVRWWGPEQFTCTHFEQDFRPGGKWRAAIQSEAYGESWSGGTYREIEDGKRLVFTFTWEQGSDAERQETTVTVTFREQDGRTIQTFHQVPFRSVDVRDSHIEGWNSLFNKEQAYAEALDTA